MSLVASLRALLSLGLRRLLGAPAPPAGDADDPRTLELLRRAEEARRAR
ncbi:MAG: hypothetical protein HYS77_07205, partial [Candidatus Rokubacteria bacterium]|nr:hypothetical protein [Candidatus Rokubacteria bacterium]